MENDYIAKEAVNTLHIGIYAVNISGRHLQDDEVKIQAGEIVLSTLNVGEDPTGMTYDTNFNYLGERAAEGKLISSEGLEQVVVHPGIIKGNKSISPVEDHVDLREVARGISELHSYKIGVRVSYDELELPTPKQG